MYRLRSSDINNETYIKAFETFDPELLNRYRSLDIKEIREIIFFSEITDEVYDNGMFALTMCDELKVPVLKREADLLYFVLQVNRAHTNRETSTRITNISQAQLCYDQSSGQFRELTRQMAPDKKIRFAKFMARHRCLYPECNIYWQIPVGFFKDGATGKTKATIVGANTNPYALISIANAGIENAQVPRSMFIKFFSKATAEGRVVTDSTDEIRQMFDETLVDEVYEILNYIGLNKFKTIQCCDDTEYYYSDEEKALIAHLLTDEAVIDECLTFNEEEIVYWPQIGFKDYRFLNRGAEYVPFKQHRTIDILM